MEQNNNEETVVLCPTKAGNGFKIVVNGIWYYAAKRNVWAVLRKGQSCVFRTIDANGTSGRSDGMGKSFPKRAERTLEIDYSDPEYVMAGAPAQ